MVILMCCSCFTVYADSGDDLKDVQDQVDLNGGYYVDYQQAFDAKGLTYENVKSLQNQGFSYKQILGMPNEKISSIVPSFGQRAVQKAILAAPSNFNYVTNVGGNGGGEYYHPNTGMVAGDFYDDNDGDWIENQAYNFTRYVYHKSGISYMYYLWGEWDNTVMTHQGHDFQDTTSNPAISFPQTGVVVSVGATGRVGIYDSMNDVTYFYAHMTGRTVTLGQRVNPGDIIGYEGSVGASSAHLHFEVRDNVLVR